MYSLNTDDDGVYGYNKPRVVKYLGYTDKEKLEIAYQLAGKNTQVRQAMLIHRKRLEKLLKQQKKPVAIAEIIVLENLT